MSNTSFDPAITETILKVVHSGSAYKIDEMAEQYSGDQSILFPNREGGISRSSREDTLAEFTARRDAGDPHLSTEHRILHVEQQGENAVALLYRRMSDQAAPFLYELRLRREDRGWRVSGETVTPWPDADTAGAFLPPRRSA